MRDNKMTSGHWKTEMDEGMKGKKCMLQTGGNEAFAMAYELARNRHQTIDNLFLSLLHSFLPPFSVFCSVMKHLLPFPPDVTLSIIIKHVMFP